MKLTLALLAWTVLGAVVLRFAYRDHWHWAVRALLFLALGPISWLVGAATFGGEIVDRRERF